MYTTIHIFNVHPGGGVRVIVVAGEVLVDLVVGPDGGVDPRLGGGPYNAARTLARLGAATTFFGGLADDRFGRLLRGALAAEGVAIGVPGPSAAPTTLALVDLDQAGVASYAFYLAGTAAADLDYPAMAAAFRAILAEPANPAPAAPRGAANPGQRPPGVGARARTANLVGAAVAVHVGALGLLMEPIGSAVERLPLADVPPDALVMLDPNCRPGAIADRAAYLAHRTHRGPGRRGQGERGRPRLPLPGLAAGRGGRVAARRRPALVLVTDGPRPARAFLPGTVLTVEVPTVDVVDTIGAGDAFGGGFLAWWRRTA